MSWAKFDDSYTENRKVRSVSAMAQHLHMFAIIHCAKGETDGFFPKYDLPLVASKARIKSPAGPMQELIDAHLMHDHGDKFEVHDFLDYNPSHAELESKRAIGAKRVGNWRRNGRRNMVGNGDCNAVTADVTGPVTNGVSNERPDPGTLSSGSDPVVLSNPDPERARSNANASGPTADRWLSAFKARYWEAKGRQYGAGEADAKATARLADLLASVPAEQNAADWERRAAMFAEFFASTDRATVAAGWPFAFFVSAFRGLAIPPDQRPKTTRDGKPAPMQARY